MVAKFVAVIVGCVMVAISVALWRHREAFARFTAEGQQAMYGDRSKRSQRAATGKNVAYPAVGFAVIGVAFIAVGIFGRAT
ncbi:hypothetical protein [Cellulomonas sp. P24]|uniref:hypothetical protein n=1 Tax=Cellulomonas sp. P24 TaxID=2885206 RepID=UPI00216B07E3|nr:hypothetical protein [Cellulomonas sp. P24]MCR6492570.1 hypothetical protein [Cellulomonas sp. P24]